MFMEVSSLSREIIHAPNGRAPASDLTTVKSAPDKSLDPQPTEQTTTGARTQAPAQPVVNSRSIGLKFTVDEATGYTVISVYDLDNDKVIRQIPPEEVLVFMRQIKALKGQILSRHL
jgi:flagellar protein FlaG